MDAWRWWKVGEHGRTAAADDDDDDVADDDNSWQSDDDNDENEIRNEGDCNDDGIIDIEEIEKGLSGDMEKDFESETTGARNIFSLRQMQTPEEVRVRSLCSVLIQFLISVISFQEKPLTRSLNDAREICFYSSLLFGSNVFDSL